MQPIIGAIMVMTWIRSNNLPFTLIFLLMTKIMTFLDKPLFTESLMVKGSKLKKVT